MEVGVLTPRGKHSMPNYYVDGFSQMILGLPIRVLATFDAGRGAALKRRQPTTAGWHGNRLLLRAVAAV